MNMNWNDPTFLRMASAVIQWFVIALASVAVCLQTVKHFVDLREKRISGELGIMKDKEQRERQQELRKQLDEAEHRIRSLDMELNVDFSAKWKDGIPPDPNHWLIKSGDAKTATLQLVVRGGSVIPVNFYQINGLTFRLIDADIVRMTFRTNASPGSDVYTLLPDQIEAIRNLDFLGFIYRSAVDGTAVTMRHVRTDFFVNGRLSFVANCNPTGSIDLKPESEGMMTFAVRGDMKVAPAKPY